MGDLEKSYKSISTQAKRQSALMKTIIWAMVVIVLASLYFVHCAHRDLQEKKLVVDLSGQYLPYEVEDASRLLRNHVELHCETVSHYLNSFDRMTIKSNQARAYFLSDKKSADRVFKTYLGNKSYNDALVLGHQFRNRYIGMELDDGQEPYRVVFWSETDVYNGSQLLKTIQIRTKGSITRTGPGKENRLGLYLSNFTQEYNVKKPLEDDEK